MFAGKEFRYDSVGLQVMHYYILIHLITKVDNSPNLKKIKSKEISKTTAISSKTVF